MLREKITRRVEALYSSNVSRDVWKVLTALSQLGGSHFNRYWGSDKCEAVFRSINRLPACFCMGRSLSWEPNLPVATRFHAPWRSTHKPYESEVIDEVHGFVLNSCFGQKKSRKILSDLNQWGFVTSHKRVVLSYPNKLSDHSKNQMGWWWTPSSPSKPRHPLRPIKDHLTSFPSPNEKWLFSVKFLRS